MKKTEFVIPAIADGVKVNKILNWKANSIGTNFLLMETESHGIVGVHEDSVAACKAAMDDDCVLPVGWQVSKSGILFQKVARGNSHPWEF